MILKRELLLTLHKNLEMFSSYRFAQFSFSTCILVEKKTCKSSDGDKEFVFN